MSILTMMIVFAVALTVTLIAGGGWAFATVYLPALLMLNQLPLWMIPHAPLTAHWAALYGIMLGLLFRQEPLRLRWCSIDVIMILLLVSLSITAWSTAVFETAVNFSRGDALEWTIPYFMARIFFRDLQIRRAALSTLVVLIGLISVAALIEFRLAPYWYLHLLRDLGMNNHMVEESYSRFGFFRVSGTVDHPIYFGNMCVALFGLIAILARTSGKRLSDPWVALALFGAFGCVITSISFTPYMGMIAGTLFFLILMILPRARMLLVPGVLLAIAAGALVTYQIAQQPLGERPSGELEGSAYIRRMIVKETWHKAVEAGPFGFGLEHDFRKDNNDDGEKFDLGSIDNTYMQFAMTRGWVYTGLWLSIAVFFAGRMTIAFARATHPSQLFPLAVATATVLGLMVSMYTVWAGGPYTVVWLIVLGLANTLVDLILRPELRAAGAAPTGAVPVVRSLSPAMAGAGAYSPPAPALVGPAAHAPLQRPI